MVWFQLFVAGVLEIVWATAAGYSEGFTRLGPSLVVLGVMPFTFWLLTVVMKRLPVGTAYAIWTGFGAAGTAVLGILTFGDPISAPRLAGLGLVIAGVMMLRLSDVRDESKEKVRAADSG